MNGVTKINDNTNNNGNLMLLPSTLPTYVSLLFTPTLSTYSNYLTCFSLYLYVPLTCSSVITKTNTTKMAEKGDVALVEREDAKSASMRTAEMLLRLIPLGLCVAALVVMLKNSQTNEFGSVSYSDLGAFKYLVHANGVCAGYSLLSAVVTAVPRPFTMSRAWTFFLLDQVFTYIILGAVATSTEVVYLAYKGDTAITWSEVCESFGGFCHKATASVSITFVVVLCYAALSLISSYRLFTRFDPPATSSHSTKPTEMAHFHG